ncbi:MULTISPECIES: hypothetical protein [unclassified Nocardioides]|uniref:hypothetical protein n=1 Tax=unclassified Nocardioides TaxID=2615069 RepID=UPI000056F757|nr:MULTISPECIES: hypothetical protein [unclassified Nocardioides]ABL81998.1 conserved hypothetical protein [Nocardioides sp. JS614]
MSRRVSLPAADDLFRPTAPPAADRGAPDDSAAVGADERSGGAKKPSGRVRHDEKMTVYVTSDELLDLEHARLLLRRSHGLAVDRGRIVREAIALALADFDAQGDDSALVRRLTEG